MNSYTEDLREALLSSKELLEPYVEKFVDIIQGYFHSVAPIHEDFIKKFVSNEQILLERNAILRHDMDGFPHILPSVLLYQNIYRHKNNFLTEDFAFQYPFKNFCYVYEPVSSIFRPKLLDKYQIDELTKMFLGFLYNVDINQYVLFDVKSGITEGTFEVIKKINGDMIIDQMNWRGEKKSNQWDVMTFIFRLIDLLIVMKKELKTKKLFKDKNIYDLLNLLYIMWDITNSQNDIVVKAFLKTLFKINRFYLNVPVV